MSPLLFALFLATFAIGTTEFAVVGLLPDIAASLDVSISRAGLLVSGYALGVAIGGPHCRPYIVAAAQADAPAALRDFRRGSRVGRAGAGLWLADGRERACGDFACLVPRHCPDRGRGERSSGARRALCLSCGWGFRPRALSACRVRPRSATRLAGAPPSGCLRRLASSPGRPFSSRRSRRRNDRQRPSARFDGARSWRGESDLSSRGPAQAHNRDPGEA
jgi:hypothetical protein